VSILRENITAWALQHFREHDNDKKIAKRDIFYHVYGILHHPGYRTKFADNLKRELPRIPLAPDFEAFAKAGKKLADLYLNYESLEPWPIKEITTYYEELVGYATHEVDHEVATNTAFQNLLDATAKKADWRLVP
jgi:predicted helicase